MIPLEALVVGFLLGCANSAHCIGMCGVFALRAAHAPAGRRLGRMLTYIFGKTFTYVFLGALTGFAGGKLTGDHRVLTGIIGCVAGGALILTGLTVLIAKKPHATNTRQGFLSRLIGPLLNAATHQPGMKGSFMLGAMTGLLPCGVVYLALLQSATWGGAAGGVALMAGFGLGTGPALTVTGLLSGGFLARVGATRARALGAVLLLTTGGFMLYRAIMPLLATQQVADGVPPCCH